MRSIEEYLQRAITGAIDKEYPGIKADVPQVKQTGNPDFGDYQSNAAMVNAKILKESPRDIAMKIQRHIAGDNRVDKCEVAGPGFLNFFINNEFILERVQALGEEKEDAKDGEVIIDYSSPNIAKQMHVGHLRSTIIGDSLKRIYTSLGYNVVADNHLGDWGTQFGKLIVAFRRWADKDAYKEDPVKELERLYVMFSQKSADEPDLEEEARVELKKLQQGDSENMALWKDFIKESLADYDELYKRMDVEFDTYHGESFFHDMMPHIIKLLRERNIAEESENALVVFFGEEDNLHPCIVQKQDGAYLYSTSDLACIEYRMKKYNVDRMIYVTDMRQETHFRQIFRIKDMLGWDVETVHVPFGLMGLPEGHFSSRKGNVIKLRELLDEAHERAYAIVEEKNPHLSRDEKENIAEVVGMGAVKYGDLSQNRVTNIIFQWDKMLNFDGNTGPYMQYTYARIRSMLRKADEQDKRIDIREGFDLRNETERSLALSLLSFRSSVISAAESYKPNIIADQLFEIAQKFNSFYNSLPVLREEGTTLNTRLLLSEKTAVIIAYGLGLLGIGTVEKM